jgi:diguanylate cyclase (GGDEF)-like protein
MPLWEENLAALRRSVRAGAGVSLLLTGGVAVYFLMTLDRPHRVELLVVDAIACAVAGAVALLPLESMARRRLITPFFLVWSASLVLVVAAVCAVENDPESPFVAFFFLPMVFAAIAYPLRLVIAVSVMVVAASAVTLGVALEHGVADTFLFALALVGAAALCALQARAHEQHVAEVARLSRTDHLTGTLNRRGFEDELAERMARFRRYGTPVGLVLLDLDGFKQVNDVQGHAAGDELLRAVAEAVDQAVRATDVTSRVGGDEFAVLLEQSDGVTAPMVAGRIVDAVSGVSGVTAGWASCPADAEDAEALYRLADTRLYEHKRDGALLRG